MPLRTQFSAETLRHQSSRGEITQTSAESIPGCVDCPRLENGCSLWMRSFSSADSPTICCLCICAEKGVASSFEMLPVAFSLIHTIIIKITERFSFLKILFPAPFLIALFIEMLVLPYALHRGYQPSVPSIPKQPCTNKLPSI